MKHQTKTVTEFGHTVVLHRYVNADGRGSLWHSDKEKAARAYERLAKAKRW